MLPPILRVCSVLLMISFQLALPGAVWQARASGSIRYAAPIASGSGNCFDWANACTLQKALDVAASGDQIWVKQGVHHPDNTLYADNDRSATFTLKNGVEIYGGFAGTETLLSQRNWRGNRTILSGDIDGNDSHGGDFINENATQIVGANAYHVVTGGGTNSSAVLDGFFITAGQANGSFPDQAGGGMYNSGSSPTLRNLILSGNTALYGGGMYNITSSPMLRDVALSGNSAIEGGGLYNDVNSNPQLTNAAFSGNIASYGGGMFNAGSSKPALTNVTFNGNSAANGGGGINNTYNSSPSLTNVILWDNKGGSILNQSSTTVLVYSLLEENGCPSGATCGNGMIYHTDPQFVDADGADNIAGTLDDNLRLQLSSPAIDAGNNAAPGLSGVTTDLKGYPRFVDISTVSDTGSGTAPIVDMGAYEAQHISPLYAAPASVGDGNCSSWANACRLADALAFAMGGEQVWVKAGVHYPVATKSDPRQATFTLKNGVEIYGGFAGTETLLSQRNWRGNRTILSGDIDGNDSHGGDYINENASQIVGANAYHVVTGGGTNSSAVLDGFFITAGQANGSFPDQAGGGMYNSGSSPTLRNLILSGNTALYGGGMYNITSSPMLRDVALSGNSAIEGGGLYNDVNSNPQLTNAAFSGNIASYGGGMFNSGSSNPALTNVTFNGNSAANGGGGINNTYSSSPSLTNVILWDNDGGSILNQSSTTVLVYSLLEENGCPSGATCGNGMIYNTDPQFVDADGADNIAGTL
jgi:hypothetical protein